jgi:hypothetical protein
MIAFLGNKVTLLPAAMIGVPLFTLLHRAQ